MGTAAALAHRVEGDGAGAVVVDGRVVEVEVVVAEPDLPLPPQSDEHAASPSTADRATPTRMERANVVVSRDMARFSPIDVIQFARGTVPQRVVRLDVCPPVRWSATLYGMGRREDLNAILGGPPMRPGQGRNSISGRHGRS